MASAPTARLDRFLAAPRRAVWVMAAPMMVGMAVHAAYLWIDTAFVGSLGEAAVAAITYVGPLFFLLIALINGFATAVTALVAQAIGARDVDEAERVAGSSILVAVALGGLFLVGGLLLGPWLLRALGARGEAHRLAWEFFQVIALVVPVFFLSSAVRAVLAGEGDARTPTYILLGSTVVNAGLDALFIFGLGLGIRGAALATAAAATLSLVAYLWLALRPGHPGVRFRLRHLRGYRPLLVGLVSLGLPTTGGQVVMSLGMAVNNRLLSHFGDLVVAGYGAASRVDMVVTLPVFGLAAAAVTLIGMFGGAGRSDLVRGTTRYVLGWAVLLTAGLGVAAVASSGILLRLFVDAPESLSTGRTYLAFMVVAYPMMAFGMVTGRVLQGLGRGVPSLVITSVRVLLVSMPVAYVGIHAAGAGPWIIWTGILLGGVVSCALSAYWLRQILWGEAPLPPLAPALAESPPSG
jgi:putative MATE family efflux protein